MEIYRGVRFAIAPVLCFISLGGAKTENFREWVLEQRGGSDLPGFFGPRLA